MSDNPIIPSLDNAEVERAVWRLPFLEREALLMKAREKMTYAEIGAELGLTPAQAEARVESALVKLHASLLQTRSAWWRVRWRPLRCHFPF